MIRVASYSLFGSNDFYWSFLPSLIRAHHNIFPGWELRIHHDSSPIWDGPKGNLLRAYARVGLVKLVYVEQSKNPWRSMLWRTLPIWDRNVELVICRDIDAIPSARERMMVERFISSGAAVHAISDNPFHNHLPLMGGMIGFRTKRFLQITGLSSWEEFIGNHSFDGPGSDQFLLSKFWEQVRPHSCEHRLRGYPPSKGTLYSTKSLEFLPLGDVPSPLVSASNSFARYVGISGYNVDRAVETFDNLGSPEITRLARAAEATVHELKIRGYADRVILSSNLDDDYCFFPPLTAALWDRVGFCTLCFLIGTEEQWKARRAVVEGLKDYGADVVYLEAVCGVSESTTAVLSKLYVGCLDLPDDVYCVTGGADMWPISRYSWKNRGKEFQFWCFVSPSQWIRFYVGATVGAWRELMNLQKQSEIMHSMRRDFGYLRNAGLKEDGYEKFLLCKAIEELQSYADRCEFMRQNVQLDWQQVRRIKRYPRWERESLNELIGACLPKPGYGRHWSELRELFSALQPDQVFDADKYRAEYLKSLGYLRLFSLALRGEFLIPDPHCSRANGHLVMLGHGSVTSPSGQGAHCLSSSEFLGEGD